MKLNLVKQLGLPTLCQQLILLLPLLTLGTAAVAKDNSLSEAEISEGWQLLFNGQDMSHWRNFKRESLSDKWVVENGTMKLVGKILYLADHRGGFHIIDLSDIYHPRRLGGYDTPGKAWDIDVKNKVAFVADDRAGLLMFDV